MFFSLKRISLISTLLFFIGACAPSIPYIKERKEAPPKTSLNEEKIKKLEEIEAQEELAIEEEMKTPLRGEGVAIFYVAHPEASTQKMLDILINNPQLRLTLIFPPRYFESQQRKEFIEKFRVLQSSKQIEIGMSLDNEPILPLLGSLGLAGDDVKDWGFKFDWKEDIAAQIARGSGIHQKRWGTIPAGFYPPYLGLSREVLVALKRFRLSWVMGPPHENWGVQFHKATALVIPKKQPVFESLPQGGAPWIQAMAQWSVNHPFTLVQGSLWDNPRTEFRFLRKLAQLAKKLDESTTLLTGQEMAETLDDEYQRRKDTTAFMTDFSDWVKTSQQQLAWQALAQAREVVEKYKNSGRANLRRLDAALEEVYVAEGGEFLLALGQTLVPLTINEQNFLATLANVYRLCGEPIPDNHNRWFSQKTRRKIKKSRRRSSEPFFEREKNNFIWTDPKEDDFGPGSYRYPSGRYPKGGFDLRRVYLSWNASNVTLRIELRNLPQKKNANVIPLVDIYMDVNRLPGAGSTNPLKGRNKMVINNKAAWEYALAMSANGGTLFQSIPGKASRKLSDVNVTKGSKSLAVTIPRSQLRGNPENWRLSVIVMGEESARKRKALLPVPVTSSPGERNFGGASQAREAPPVIDLLADTVDTQIQALERYQRGAKVRLPYAEAE